MENTAESQLSNKIKWAYTALTVVVIWFALVLQFSISIPAYVAAGRSTGGALLELFSFFTILSNLLVVLSLTILLLKPNSAWGRFFSKGVFLTAVVVYITVVGLVYSILLRQLWHPEGWFKVADELLHTINPILAIIYWFAFVPKADLKWVDILYWLWYPFIYFIYILIRGAISGDYPYPFMNVTDFGYARVTINCLIILLVFYGIGAIYTWVGRLISKKPAINSL
jgi:hypothetical protein